MATPLCESTTDSISNLSGDVIELILVLLPIKEAAKTSLLSRKWRHRWRSIPQLVFDGRFALIDENDGFLRDENKVMMKIYEALLAHHGPITKLELSIPGFRRDPSLDILMFHLSSKGVQELTICFDGSDNPTLHSSLFSAAFPLKRLKLYCCDFAVPSSFVGFSKLTLLELKFVTLPHYFYEKVLPCCPLLEELSIICCDNTEPVFVAPSLKVLLFHSTMSKICFKYTPLLSVASVLDVGQSSVETISFAMDKPDMVSLFVSLPSLEHLNLGLELLLLLVDGHVPYQLPTALHNLKSLEVPRILLHRLPQAQLDDSYSYEHTRSKVIHRSCWKQRTNLEFVAFNIW